MFDWFFRDQSFHAVSIQCYEVNRLRGICTLLKIFDDCHSQVRMRKNLDISRNTVILVRRVSKTL